MFLIGGKYTYFGLKEGLTHTLSEQDTSKYDHFEISLNIDGLPIFKSKNLTMWPLQCAVINIDEVKNSPFVVALFSGAKKPNDLEFLRDFMEELQELMETGFKGKRIVLKNIICDAPARALIKGIVQFNGRYGCDFCDVKGVHESKMLFLYKGNLRTNESFRQKTNPEHHKTDSILLNLDIDMIRQFPIDPMHCVDLGVTKRMLMLWKEGPLAHRLSAGHLSTITYFHQAVRHHIPPEFNRKPRGLDELKHWKATEFRTFLLYTGPVILKYVLDKEKYIHFLSLSIGMRILYSENLMEHRDYADELLTYFVEKGSSLYSMSFISYNVHCLLHLTDVANYNRSLHYCSAYKFENNMGQIKRFIRGSSDPLIQVANRLAERQAISSSKKSNVNSGTPKTKECYRMTNDSYCLIHGVQENLIFCEVFCRMEPLYTKPCDSRIIGIFKGFRNHTKMLHTDTTQLRHKAIMIPLSLIDKDEYNAVALIPLMHSV